MAAQTPPDTPQDPPHPADTPATQSWPGEPAPAPPPLPGKGPVGMTGIPGSYPGSDQPSAWPKTFGIISLVLAGSGLLYTPLMAWQQSSGSSFGMGAFYDSMPPWYGTYLWTVTLIAMAEALLLLLPAALLLFKRRKLGVTLHLAYAVVAAITAIVSNIIMFVALEEARSQMDPVMANAAQSGLFMGALFGLAYPGILIWWFLRPKIRKETAAWKS
jgi:hypothetical protein